MEERMSDDRFAYEAEANYYRRQLSRRFKGSRPLGDYIRSLGKVEEILSGGRVLDLGAGDCQYTRAIARDFNPQQVVAMDLVAERMLPALVDVRDRGGAQSEDGQTVAVRGVGGDCFYLPFRDQSFDVAFGSLVLHRFRDLESVLLEVHRVLRTGGTYLGIEPSAWNVMHLWRHLASDHSPNEYLLSGRRVRQAFMRSGFAVRVLGLAPRFPLARRLGLATCMGIRAHRI
jgi:SAM-dependent methyltransferase